MNPETEDFDYIADENKTTELKSYAPAIDQDLSILPGEPDYEWFYKRYKARESGSDAHHVFLVTYLGDGDNTSGFYTDKQEAVLKFNDFNATDGKLNFNISFCGTRTPGSVVIAEGVATFTATAAP